MDESLGRVTVAPEVLLAIVRMTALSRPGVARLSASHPSSFQRLFNGKVGEGIRIEIEDGAVVIDLHIVAEPDAQMLELGQTLQREVSRAIHDVVGMPVKEINIHIEDVIDRVPSLTEPSID
ncbi:MAG: Asp23/Gls24 family envelope stress response protein [Chloroflexi bacterium]|nr:Asp23/Gls24 family envelope stress response protein [Chloroflexota bacterium]